MTKTYSSKSNANRAARAASMFAGAVPHEAAQDANGLWIIRPVSTDGVDEVPADEVPTVQVEQVQPGYTIPTEPAAEDDDLEYTAEAVAARNAARIAAQAEQARIDEEAEARDREEAAAQRAEDDALFEAAEAAKAAQVPVVVEAPVVVVPEVQAPVVVAAPVEREGFLVCLTATAAEATEFARFIATRYSRKVEIYSNTTEALVQTVEPAAKAARVAKAAGAVRTPRVTRDWTVKPIVTSQANLALQKLFDKIEAQRGNLAALQALNTFKRTSTYYIMAGRYLDALVAEATPEAAPLAA